LAHDTTLFDRPKGQDLRYLRRTISFLKPYSGLVVAAVAALAVTGLSVLGLGQGLKVLIDSGFANDNPDALNNALLILLALSLIMAGGTFARFYFVSWLGERVVADLRQAVFDRILSFHRGFFETTKTGEVLSRLTTDTTLLQSVIGSSASIALRSMLNLVGGIIMMFITNLSLTTIVLVVMPVVIVPILTFGRRVRKLSRASQDRVADVGAFAEETINAMSTVQAFSHEDVDRDQFRTEVTNAFDTAIVRIRMRGLLMATVIFLVFGAIGIILWTGGRQMLTGEITSGELAAFIYYASLVAVSVGAMSEIYGELQRAAGATERLIELLVTETEIKAPDNPLALPENSQGRLSLENVTFHYPSRPNQAALKDFTLNVNPGETVALVGPSGSGKSTVFQLLLRFYDPDSGMVKLDDINVRDADPKAVRERFSLVPQDPVLFGSSGWENIRYSLPKADDAMVRKAAEAAEAAKFLDELPDGFSTFIGEKGMRLSGGQRQRISLARAILRDPSVLLLDEATSALDAESERLVQVALETLKAGRTTLVIAHRLATVVNADRIAVIEQGQIVAIGTHEELLVSSPLYAHFAALQFGVDARQANLDQATNR